MTVDVKRGFEMEMEKAKTKSREGGKKFAVTAVKGEPAAHRRFAQVRRRTGDRKSTSAG